ncbi:hypothetical protein [Amycolatopsis cihanbeyliensis]|uniref:Uncharacterized protein n=1 Tax=Amycolatopsis cihanbeyliensis TaxID=1128664 RepID=A0A542DQR7_AMYCI|nr:hypothetical protein [Amycolatopsis cihanbeyliensis]TQJ05295.1 hypothetical protein FB471_5123 [Amycolatopsis cihanbeyliensis]
MNAGKAVMPYRKERALEDAAFRHGFTPVRLFSLLLPVWQVDVRATTVEGKPYELIDRYLERGLAECGLNTVAELAAFFSLDEVLVDRAIRFLAGIGHLTGTPDGGLTLTDLGRNSHRDQVCYVVERQDRRRLYFDGYTSLPLTRRHYDAGVVTFLTLAQAGAMHGRDQDFRLLATTKGFRRETLAELARYRDRERYNLPHRLDRPESLGEECVFLPVHVIRAVQPGGKIRFLAYGQAADTADPELSELCEQAPEIQGALANEDTTEEEQRTRITSWLLRKGLSGYRPVRFPHGGWQVELPRSAFEPSGPIPCASLGSFAALSTTVVRIWCADKELREQGFLDRVESFARARQRKAGEVTALATKAGRQLGFESTDLSALRAMAAAAGRDALVLLLDSLN